MFYFWTLPEGFLFRGLTMHYLLPPKSLQFPGGKKEHMGKLHAKAGKTEQERPLLTERFSVLRPR